MRIPVHQPNAIVRHPLLACLAAIAAAVLTMAIIWRLAP